jgi:hypothetical protein
LGKPLFGGEGELVFATQIATGLPHLTGYQTGRGKRAAAGKPNQARVFGIKQYPAGCWGENFKTGALNRSATHPARSIRDLGMIG